MKNNTKDISILRRMIRYCDEIAQMVDRFGDSMEAFASDFAYQHACSMCIVQLGELSAHLSDAFKDKHNKIPWKGVKAMRNLFAHNYEGLSIAQTWQTIQGDIPALQMYCTEIISQYAGQ